MEEREFFQKFGKFHSVFNASENAHCSNQKEIEEFFKSYRIFVLTNDFCCTYMPITQQEMFSLVHLMTCENPNSVELDENMPTWRAISFTILWDIFIIDVFMDSKTNQCYISFETRF